MKRVNGLFCLRTLNTQRSSNNSLQENWKGAIAQSQKNYSLTTESYGIKSKQRKRDKGLFPDFKI